MEDKKVSIKSWIFTHIMCIIPVVNIIYIIGMLLGISSYKSKVTYFRSFFVILLIIILVYIIMLGVAYYQNTHTFDFKDFFTQIKNMIINWYDQAVEYFKNFFDQFKQA